MAEMFVDQRLHILPIQPTDPGCQTWKRHALDLLAFDQFGERFETVVHVLDGGKALHAAVKKYAGESASIQRCQIHKRRNVIDHLTEEHKPSVEKKLIAAYAIEDYSGDRVLAYVAGVASMIQTAFQDKTEFFVLDELYPQNIYNAARNVEIAVWKLSNARNAKGSLFLLSNEGAGPVVNLSFEREVGNMPELGWKYGYAFFWFLVIVIVVGLLLWLRRKRWI